MHIFKLRDAVVNEYRDYMASFVRVLALPPADPRVAHPLALHG